MSGARRAKHIDDVLMVYNRSTPHHCGLTRRKEMDGNCDYIRTRPAYARLDARPDSRNAIRAIRARRAETLVGV
jgi:hypothetical protein